MKFDARYIVRCTTTPTLQKTKNIGEVDVRAMFPLFIKNCRQDFFQFPCLSWVGVSSDWHKQRYRGSSFGWDLQKYFWPIYEDVHFRHGPQCLCLNSSRPSSHRGWERAYVKSILPPAPILFSRHKLVPSWYSQFWNHPHNLAGIPRNWTVKVFLEDHPHSCNTGQCKWG